MPLEQSDFDRIQGMIDRVMPRSEYEQRHQALALRVQNLEDNMKESARNSNIEHQRMNDLTDRRFREYQDIVKGLQVIIETNRAATAKTLDDIKEAQANSNSMTLRYIISQIVSFLVGGGIIGVIELLLRNGK